MAQHERDVAAQAERLFAQRVGVGKPVIAWWYWLPLPLPPPLDKVGRAADAPRRLRVTADDMIDPAGRD
ncbi:hypothetical protein A9W95_18260 [Mycobacterium sp. 1423905.2]|nr:hypothetical protein A9W95_18260 [Mycobacterium sp. 1423905.2]